MDNETLAKELFLIAATMLHDKDEALDQLVGFLKDQPTD
jgi:hypothetical protein